MKKSFFMSVICFLIVGLNAQNQNFFNSQSADSIESGCVKKEVECLALKNSSGQILKSKSGAKIPLEETISMTSGKEKVNVIIYPDKFSKSQNGRDTDPNVNDTFLANKKSFEDRSKEGLLCCKDDKCKNIDTSIGPVNYFAKEPVDFVAGKSGSTCGNGNNNPQKISDKNDPNNDLKDLSKKLKEACDKNPKCVERRNNLNNPPPINKQIILPEPTSEDMAKACDAFIKSPNKDMQDALSKICAGS